MPIILKAGRDIAPIPAGMHQGICYSVADIGSQPSKFGLRHKVVLTFELPHELGEFERDGKTQSLPRAISGIWTHSLHRKASLRRELESWRGRQFSADESEGFDLKNVLGASCQLNIVHAARDGRTFANIAGIVPLAKGMVKVAPVNALVYFALDEFLAGGGTQWPPSLPDWVRARVMQSEEYLRAMQSPAQPMQPVDENPEVTESDDVPF